MLLEKLMQSIFVNNSMSMRVKQHFLRLTLEGVVSQLELTCNHIYKKLFSFASLH